MFHGCSTPYVTIVKSINALSDVSSLLTHRESASSARGKEGCAWRPALTS